MRDLLVEGSHCVLRQVQSSSLLLGKVAVSDIFLLPSDLHHVIASIVSEKLLVSHIVDRYPLTSPIKVLLQSNI